MNIRKPVNREELIRCVEIYSALNDEDFIPSNYKASLSSIIKHWKTGEFIRVIEKGDEIIGFITAEVHVLRHCAHKQLEQTYYVTNQQGFTAARAVILAHQELIKYGEEIGVPIITSHCSHLDETRVLCRILQKNGWKVKGHVAVWRTSHARGM